MSNNKKTTISDYLKGIKIQNLSVILENLFLTNISIELFFKVFDKVVQTPQDVANFIMDNKNHVELGTFGYRASGADKIYAYNGMSKYQGVKATLGSSHSNFHG